MPPHPPSGARHRATAQNTVRLPQAILAAQSDATVGPDPTVRAIRTDRDATGRTTGRHRQEPVRPPGGRRVPNRVLGPALTFGVVTAALLAGFVGLRGTHSPADTVADDTPVQVQTLLEQNPAAGGTASRPPSSKPSTAPSAASKPSATPKPADTHRATVEPTRKPAARTATPKPTRTVKAVPKPAVKPSAKPAVKPSAKPAVVRPVAGLDQTQMNNAATIVKVGQEMGLSKFGLVIGVATAMQESALYNLASDVVPESLNYPHQGTGADHDSVGLFQQRYTSGWGTVAQIMKPRYAAGAFFSALDNVQGWENMALTEAAQTVQVSAYPDAYAKHEDNATAVVEALS